RSDAAATVSFCDCAEAKQAARKKAAIKLRTNNHHLGRFHQGCRRLSLFQRHLAYCVRGNDRCYDLPTDRQFYLRHEAAHFDLDHPPNQLIAPAYRTEVTAARLDGSRTGSVQETVQFTLRNAMMSPAGLHRFDLSFVDPLLDGGIA